MQITIDQFVLDQVFHRWETPDGPVFYRFTVDEDSWLVLWPDGEHLHTYRYPPDWLESVL